MGTYIRHCGTSDAVLGRGYHPINNAVNDRIDDSNSISIFVPRYTSENHSRLLGGKISSLEDN